MNDKLYYEYELPKDSYISAKEVAKMKKKIKAMTVEEMMKMIAEGSLH